MTELRPGTSPPPVKIPMRLADMKKVPLFFAGIAWSVAANPRIFFSSAVSQGARRACPPPIAGLRSTLHRSSLRVHYGIAPASGRAPSPIPPHPVCSLKELESISGPGVGRRAVVARGSEVLNQRKGGAVSTIDPSL